MNSVMQYLLRDLRTAYRDFLDPLHERASGTDFSALDTRIGLDFTRDYDEAFAIWNGLGYLSDVLGPRGSGTVHARPDLAVMQRMCEREREHIERLKDPDRAFAHGFWDRFADKLADPDYAASLPDIYGRD